MTNVECSYKCSNCNRWFYSLSTNAKSALTRHLGQCASLKNDTVDGNDIMYNHAELNKPEDYAGNYFNEDIDNDNDDEYMEADSDNLFHGVPDSTVQEAYEIYGADRVMIESTLSGAHILLSNEEKAIPCNTVFEYQQMIQQNYDRKDDGTLWKKPIAIRSLSGSETIHRFWEDTIEIFNLWVAMNVSISDGDKILSTIQSICKRNFEVTPQIPKTMKSIVEACKGSEQELFPSKTWIYHLPTRLFGEKGLDGAKLKPTTAIVRDIGSVIGRALLDVSLENFAIKPDIVKSEDDGQRMFGAFSTGTMFENLHKEVHAHAVPDSTTEYTNVALALAISSDVTTLNKSQSIDGNGLQLLILNVCGKERKPNLVGMIPERNNAYSVRQLHELLKNRGFKFKKDRTAIIAYVNRQMKLSYISEALSPLLIYQQSGLILQVGNKLIEEESVVIRAYPHVSLILADTLESNQYAGVSMKTKKQCRCCLQGNCNECLIDKAIGEMRDQNHHNVMSTLAGTIQELMWSYTADHPGRKLKLTAQQRNVMNEASRLCIQFGHNPMYVHFSLQNSWNVNSMHQAVLPDSLHTWSKGLIENLISQSLICFRQVARLAKEYCPNLSILDTNISAFPAHHTLSPWRFSRFPRGITPYQKKSKSKKEGTCTTGFFSGSVPAYRLAGLLAQLLFSIRLDGTSLPTSTESLNMYRRNLRTNEKMNTEDMLDIQNTLVDAIVIALDFDMYSRAPFLKESDIIAYKRLLSNTVFRFLKVFRMNSVLSQLRNFSSKSSNTITIVAKNPGGVKMHLLFHTLDNIERVGKEKNSTDTEVTESFQKVIKTASQRGTQKTRTEGTDIIKILNRNARAHDFGCLLSSQSVTAVNIPLLDRPAHIHEIPVLHFEVAKNCSHQNIIIDRERRTILVEEKYKNVNGKRVHFLPLIHEVLSLDDLYLLLADKIEINDDRQIRLLNSLKCTGSPAHGIDPFMIRANSNYSTESGGHISIQCNRQDFGFVKIDVEDSNGTINVFTALVVGIVEVSSIAALETNRTIFSTNILVCWLHSVSEREKIDTTIPYPQVKLTFKNNSARSALWFDVMPTTAIKSPLFVIPILSSVDNYFFGQSILPHKRKLTFYELSVEKVIFWGTAAYDDFTEADASLQQFSTLSRAHTFLLSQSDIEKQSEMWMIEEHEQTSNRNTIDTEAASSFSVGDDIDNRTSDDDNEDIDDDLDENHDESDYLDD